MSQWFYAEGNRERRGPISDEDITQLFQSRRIDEDTLVWREGAGDWRPLREFAGELVLDLQNPVSASAPPVPPSLPPGLQTIHTTSAAAPRQGLSGCAIAGIIAAVVGVILIAILAILAAIAMPAYQQYVMRSKTTMVSGQLLGLKHQVAEFVAANQRCPINDDEGFGTPESYASGDVAQVHVGRFEEGHCGLEAFLRVPSHSQLDGKSIWLDYDMQADSWECSSDVDDNYLPIDCRG
ncbi:MAG: pilus assembly protein PilA [Stenotrophomonas sp.]|nr:MAG: pilus assembly protein PilA [Stenotrophomonas sp.]